MSVQSQILIGELSFADGPENTYTKGIPAIREQGS